MSPPNLFRVAVIMDGRVEYEREVLRGIRDYATDNGEWLIRLEPPRSDTAEFLKEWKPDGVLYQSAGLDPHVLRVVKRYRDRAVHVSDVVKSQELSSFVGMDNVEIGSMAADYFVGLGRANLAFVGVRDSGFSQRRGKAFASKIADHGGVSQSYYLDDWNSRRREEGKVVAFLERLSLPCSLFATHDECALWLSTLCRSMGIQIPGDIAILGVDNDELICELAWPTISSIAMPSRQVGFEASQLLDQVLKGGALISKSKLLRPDQIVIRDSTRAPETPDENVNRAIRFMRDHISKPINAADVARGVGVSRRLLERKFKVTIQKSPLAVLQNLRIERAKSLLADSELTLAAIADQCGCADASQLIVRFRRETGMTPGEFRRSIDQG
ncbi:substrate-binding domain-containing protein [Verrucomicrobiales bacterium]|nr:substrate-binding domain-containing protein [Verrucomicrobiales bacterium]